MSKKMSIDVNHNSLTDSEVDEIDEICKTLEKKRGRPCKKDKIIKIKNRVGRPCKKSPENLEQVAAAVPVINIDDNKMEKERTTRLWYRDEIICLFKKHNELSKKIIDMLERDL